MAEELRGQLIYHQSVLRRNLETGGIWVAGGSRALGQLVHFQYVHMATLGALANRLLGVPTPSLSATSPKNLYCSPYRPLRQCFGAGKRIECNLQNRARLKRLLGVARDAAARPNGGDQLRTPSTRKSLNRTDERHSISCNSAATGRQLIGIF